jgi:hypothetical protein
MFVSRRDGTEPVTCIACGVDLAREDAREYDKYGNRWERGDKEFEYLCKPCYRDLCHQPRDELEALLVEVDAGENADREFLDWYSWVVEERYGPIEER